MTVGRVLAGRYRLLSKLGEGGMGSVWEAEHLELGTRAAIKLIDPRIAEHPEALARFKKEARAAASLRGNHVVQILDYGLDAGAPFIAMELLEGENLGDRLERERKLSPDALVGIYRQVGKVLARAHEAGIVHRDLKPDNIFLARDGQDEVAKLLDFGIAKANAPPGELPSSTQTGAMLGTPHYMSPEQASGRRTVDHRTDVWALGVIAYECLTGQRPFEDETIGGLVLSICTEEVPVASELEPLPEAFDTWYRRSTAKDPEQRFASITAQIEALELALCPPRGAKGTRQAPAIEASPAPAGLAPFRRRLTSAQAPNVVPGPQDRTQATVRSAERRTKRGGPSWLFVAALISLILSVSTFLWLRAETPQTRPPEDASAETPEAAPDPEPLSQSSHAETAAARVRRTRSDTPSDQTDALREEPAPTPGDEPNAASGGGAAQPEGQAPSEAKQRPARPALNHAPVLRPKGLTTSPQEAPPTEATHSP